MLILILSIVLIYREFRVAKLKKEGHEAEALKLRQKPYILIGLFIMSCVTLCFFSILFITGTDINTYVLLSDGLFNAIPVFIFLGEYLYKNRIQERPFSKIIYYTFILSLIGQIISFGTWILTQNLTMNTSIIIYFVLRFIFINELRKEYLLRQER